MCIDLEVGEVLPAMPVYAELAMKLVLNAITTGAHVRKGEAGAGVACAPAALHPCCVCARA